MSTTWEEALDSFAANLQLARKQLDDGVLGPAQPAPLINWPPDDLVDQPIPGGLRGRARELFDESLELQTELGKLRDAIPGDQQSRRRTRHSRSRPISHRFSSDL